MQRFTSKISFLDHLQSLIEAAKQHNVRFYYALSPGLDICYSSQKEVNAIKQKLEQVKHENFHILVIFMR